MECCSTCILTRQWNIRYPYKIWRAEAIKEQAEGVVSRYFQEVGKIQRVV